MIIGLLGAPNKGKSTLFNALTGSSALIANYPFTTIDPNKAVAYVTSPCVDKELNVKCTPRNSKCEFGIRKIPVNIIDVAGLVEDASEGKGMGNEFLGDVSVADALIIVADASGKTNSDGNPADSDYDVCQDVLMVKSELTKWLKKSLIKNLKKNRGKPLSEFVLGLKSLGYSEKKIEEGISYCKLSNKTLEWTEDDLNKLGDWLSEFGKPIVIAANKMDLESSKTGYKILNEKFAGAVYPICADMQLAINKGIEKGFIKNTENGLQFETNNLNGPIKAALEKIETYLKEHKTTGVQEILNGIVFNSLRKIVVYPVEDETHFSDHFSHILPDAILLDENSTPLNLSGAIHTDLEKGFLYAIDAKTKKKLGKNEQLQTGSVIKIVSTR